MRLRIITAVFLCILLVSHAQAQGASNPRGYATDILAETFGYAHDEVDVDLETIYQGCPARDCIPSVDEPAFQSASEVDFLEGDDLLLSVNYRGIVRAYPTRFMDRHEIVNDEFDGVPVAVTYCPLCGSGLAFLRNLDGEAVEFGVSGLLHNNDLIMYDRAGNSLWQQITGAAFAGPRRGETLESVPVTMSEWRVWKTAHSEGSVLQPPSANIEYVQKVYGDYDQSDRLLFPVTLQDARLHRKQVVYGVKVGEQAIAVDAAWLAEQESWSHELEEGLLALEIAPGGGVLATLNGKPISAHRMFWFAWYSFNPLTALINGDG